LLWCAALEGQQITTGAPLHGVTSGFSENFNVGFGFNLRGGNPNGTGSRIIGLAPGGGGFANNPFTPNGDIQFRQGAALGPAVGGGGGVAGFGAAVLGGPGSAFLTVNAGQVSNRTFSSETPMVTTLNGYPGYFSDTIQRPFVISTIPVVGGAPLIIDIPQAPQPNLPRSISPLRQRVAQLQAGGSAAGGSRQIAAPVPANAGFDRKLSAAGQSSAGRGAASLSLIRQHQAAEEQAAEQAASAELSELIGRAESALESGRRGAAKVYLRMAASRAEGTLKQDLLERLSELE
jgi:hypothetical protein